MKSYILRQPKKFNRSKTAGELSQYEKVNLETLEPKI